MPLFGWEKVGRDDPNYKACLIGAGAAGTIVGAGTGSFLGPAGTLAGYAGGAVWGVAGGFLVCPYLVPAIKRKIETGMPLTGADVRSAAEAMGRYANVKKASDALKLLALVKRVPSAIVAADTGMSPEQRAGRLIARA